jgi:hypothetical protein
MTSLSALDPLAWLDQGEEEVDVRLLLARRELVVPLTGAGVSRGAGVPTSAELAAEMLAWTDGPTIDPARVNETDVRSVAEAFIDAGMDVLEIKRRVAARIGGVALAESPTVSALARASSRLV